MLHRGRPREARSRLNAGALALVFFSAQLVALAHFSTAAHVTCADHGELVDVLRSEHHHVGAATQGPSLETGDADAHGQGHGRCLFASYADQQSAPSARAILATTLVPAADVPPAAPHAAPSRPLRTLFRLAPKTSPPV